MLDALRSRSRRTAVLGLTLAGATALTACLTPLFPDCSDEERAEFASIQHFGTDVLVPEDDPVSGCRATFATEADPHDVIEHYESALEAAGWNVDPPFEAQLQDEANAAGTVFEVSGAKGPMATTIKGTRFEGEPTSWVLLLRRVSN